VGSGNVVKSTVGTQARTTGAAHGIKRTSSGLAKAIGSQEEFDYPPLNITDSGKDMSSTTRTSVKTTTTTSYAPVFFDENDFDSDVELDVEDLAAKDSIQLPAVPSPGARDSGYGSGVADIESKLVADSSQPIPWSSSPVSHLRSPPVKPPQPTKRRTLPWLEEEKAKEEQRAASARYQEDREPSRKKRRSTTDVAANATPASKPSFPWNSTASAVKQQQKSLREAKKNLVKANDGTEEDVKRAIQQKKKDTVHRIFLSEEQKHILNLVLNEGKSVFFTGSAGKRCKHRGHVIVLMML
jgi:ATP-dependent DNA helicase PIF1